MHVNNKSGLVDCFYPKEATFERFFNAVFAAFAPGLPAGVEGFLEKQRRPATNTAEAKGQMCISACVEKEKEKKKERFRQEEEQAPLSLRQLWL